MPRPEATPQDKKNKLIISQNLNSLANTENKKQVDIHRTTGIPKSTLTGYFKGTSLPTPGNIQKLADFFGVLKSDIDPRFSNESSTTTLPRNSVIDTTVEIMGSLNEMYQHRVLQYAREQKENQNLAYPDTLAAHQADDGHVINDHEAKHIANILDDAIDKFNGNK